MLTASPALLRKAFAVVPEAARRGAPPLTPWWMRSLRLLHLFLHLTRMWLGALFVATRLAGDRRHMLVRRWAHHMLDLLAIRVVVRGEVPPPHKPVLLVSNHISWLDTYALNVASSARFVAKSEVRRWPFIGTIARRFGTFFIVRGSLRDAARIKDALASALRSGATVAAFPEGTTTDGGTVRHFYAALLQAAVDAETVVQPVAIRYRAASGVPTAAAAFVGDMTVADSLRRILREPSLSVELTFCPPLYPFGRTRRDLADQARSTIIAALGLIPREDRHDRIFPVARKAA